MHGASRQTLGDWLSETRFSLALSSGFFGFYAHAGMLAALERNGLLRAPLREGSAGLVGLAGSSAGAPVSGLWAAGIDAQEIGSELKRLRRDDFWDPGLGIGLLRGEKFLKKLISVLPENQFSRCRIPVRVSVFDLWARRTEVLEKGSLAQAMVASCALPGLFHPVKIDGRLYIDGGVADRSGLRGIPLGQRVLHHHLASRSPWRGIGKRALAAPRRDNLVSLVIEDLPRVGPFRLPRGADAFDRAYQETSRALERTIESGVVRL